MRGAAVFPLAWSLLLAALAAVLWVWSSDPLPPALLSGASLAAAVTAGCLALAARRRTPAEPEARAVPDLSLATVIAAPGVVMLLLGTAFGQYLLLIGGGLVAFALAAVGRELHSARQRERSALGGQP